MPEPAAPTNDTRLALPATRAAMITEQLRRMIHSGELAPGTRLRQNEFAARFGVSSTPVREAFTALAREGVVRQDAHRGAVVFQPQLADLFENYEIRGVLEPLATEIAAKEIATEALEELDDLIAQMRAATKTDLARYQDLNRRFHARIYESANRPKLAGLIESLRDAAEAYLRLNLSRPGRSEWQKQVHAEHEAITAALRERNARTARKLMTEHLEHNRRQLEIIIDEPS